MFATSDPEDHIAKNPSNIDMKSRIIRSEATNQHEWHYSIITGNGTRAYYFDESTIAKKNLQSAEHGTWNMGLQT